MIRKQCPFCKSLYNTFSHFSVFVLSLIYGKKYFLAEGKYSASFYTMFDTFIYAKCTASDHKIQHDFFLTKKIMTDFYSFSLEQETVN